MGGHAVRHFGIDRNTIDVDVHVSADVTEDIEDRLRRSRLFADAGLQAGPRRRPPAHPQHHSKKPIGTFADDPSLRERERR
jgi:hypothetical protein